MAINFNLLNQPESIIRKMIIALQGVFDYQLRPFITEDTYQHLLENNYASPNYKSYINPEDLSSDINLTTYQPYELKCLKDRLFTIRNVNDNLIKTYSKYSAKYTVIHNHITDDAYSYNYHNLLKYNKGKNTNNGKIQTLEELVDCLELYVNTTKNKIISFYSRNIFNLDSLLNQQKILDFINTIIYAEKLEAKLEYAIEEFIATTIQDLQFNLSNIITRNEALVLKHYIDYPYQESEIPDNYICIGTYQQVLEYYDPKIQKIIDLTLEPLYGNNIYNKNTNSFIMPYTYNLKDIHNYYVVNAFMNYTFINYVLKILLHLDISNVNISVIDPGEMDINIGPLLPILKYANNKLLTTKTETYTFLEECINNIELQFQTKLQNKYKSIYDYNISNLNEPIPYNLICIFDQEDFFDKKMLAMLQFISQFAPNSGYIILFCSSNRTFSNYFNKLEFDILECTEFGFGICKHEDLNLSYTPNYIEQSYTHFLIDKEDKSQSYILGKYYSYTPIETLTNQQISQLINSLLFNNFNKHPIANELEECNSTRNNKYMEICPGVLTNKSSIIIKLGENSSHHILISGATGSGKSTLLHTIILNSISSYSPEELQLYLMDFKSGTEFKLYDGKNIPHIKVLAIDAMQEFGESILMELVEEQARRSKLFKLHPGVSNITDFIELTGNKLPRILVVIDEFQVLFDNQSNSRIAMHCGELLNKIVTEGRAFGIHLIMATQTLRSVRVNTSISASVLDQMRVRIGLKCNEDEAALLFGDDKASDAVEKMKGPIGTAVLNPEYTEKENIPIKVTHYKLEQQLNILNTISASYPQASITRVFEGGKIPTMPESIITNRNTEDKPIIDIAIGEPIRMEEDLSITYSKRMNTNLLIVGSSTELMYRLMHDILIATSSYEDIRIHYLSGLFFLGDSDDYTDQLVSRRSNIELIGNEDDALSSLSDMINLFHERKEKKDTSGERHVLIIDGIQYLDVIRNLFEDNSYGFSSYDTDTKAIDYKAGFQELIAQGYAYGINVIITGSDYQGIRDIFSYDSAIINKLRNRIVFDISESDMDQLINGMSISSLKSGVAVFTDGIRRTLQFKPYQEPEIDKL